MHCLESRSRGSFHVHDGLARRRGAHLDDTARAAVHDRRASSVTWGIFVRSRVPPAPAILARRLVRDYCTGPIAVAVIFTRDIRTHDAESAYALSRDPLSPVREPRLSYVPHTCRSHRPRRHDDRSRAACCLRHASKGTSLTMSLMCMI
jgi:hypothetical protein